MAAAVIAAVAAGSELVSFDPDKDVAPAVADGIVGAVLLAAAAIARHRRPGSRVGLLMGGAGVAWFAGTLWPLAIFWHRGPLVHLHLSYPRGRLRWRPAVLTVAAVYAVSAIEPIAGNDALTIAIAVVVAMVAVCTFGLASGTAKRAGIPALIAALALAGALSFGAFNRQYDWQSDSQALWIYDTVIVGAVLILLVDLLAVGGPTPSSPVSSSTSDANPEPERCATNWPGRSATRHSSSATGRLTSGDISTTPDSASMSTPLRLTTS